MKQSIGDGQTKTPVPLCLHTSKSEMNLRTFYQQTELDPTDLFINTIKDLRVYAKNPQRVKTDLKQKISCFPGRHLSFKEIAIIERKMLVEGEDIKPKFSNMEVKMNKEGRTRLEKLYDVVKHYVAVNKYFKSTMLEGESGLVNRKHITNDEKYFNRTIRDDLNRLRKKGLIYSRGRPPAWYLGSDEFENSSQHKSVEIEEEGNAVLPKLLIPENITVNINLNVKFL